jgi:hypothetical protein
VRGVEEGLIACPDAADLYNVVFKGWLAPLTTLALGCDGGRLVVSSVR